MRIDGRVQNGVVVLEGKVELPEGSVVTVWFPEPVTPAPHAERRQVQVPFVRSAKAGSLNLTSEQIATILDEEDASTRH